MERQRPIDPETELHYALHQRLALAALGSGLPVLAILWVVELRRDAVRLELIGLYAVVALLCLWAIERVLRRKSMAGTLKIIIAFNLIFIALQAYLSGTGQSPGLQQTQFSMLLMLIANAILGYLLFSARSAGLLSLGGYGLAVGAGLLRLSQQGDFSGLLPSMKLYLSTGTILLLLHALAWYKARFILQSQEQLRLEHEAYTDALTGLPNRRRLYQQIGALLDMQRSDADGDSEYGSVVMLDIDHFKRINDQHGHPTGDQALIHIAGLVQGAAQPGETPGRWGGEEFMLVLPDVSEAGAVRRVEELRRALLASPHPQVGQITASFGISACRPGDDLTRLVARVDDALYLAKAGGRDRVEVAGGGPAQRPEHTSTSPAAQ